MYVNLLVVVNITVYTAKTPKVNNIVNNQEQYGQQNIVQACFQQHCYRLGVFCSVANVVQLYKC
jgi:hypothetical protein